MGVRIHPPACKVSPPSSSLRGAFQGHGPFHWQPARSEGARLFASGMWPMFASHSADRFQGGEALMSTLWFPDQGGKPGCVFNVMLVLRDACFPERQPFGESRVSIFSIFWRIPSSKTKGNYNKFLCHFAENQSLDFRAVGSSADCISCDECIDADPAILYCTQCVKRLCAECSEHHRRSKASASHSLTKLKEQQEHSLHRAAMCASHHRELEFFCESCNVMCCRDCITAEHETRFVVSNMLCCLSLSCVLIPFVIVFGIINVRTNQHEFNLTLRHLCIHMVYMYYSNFDLHSS